MRGSWVYNYYCDESCHLQKDGKRFMVLGYIAAPLHKIEQMKGELKSLRVKYKNTLEVKWTYLNEWNYPFYAKLVDWFFKKGGMRFRAIIVDISCFFILWIRFGIIIFIWILKIISALTGLKS